MDISRLHPIKISTHAKGKVMHDFFPDLSCEEDLLSTPTFYKDKAADIHAGILCLYATTLITQVYETDPFLLEPYYEQRAKSLKNIIKTHPKFKNLTDTETSKFVNNLIAKDIRNCFAHGNFDISYDIHTKKVFFVLRPQGKTFACNEPIIISKNTLINANKKFLSDMGTKYLFSSKIMLQNILKNNLNDTLKSFILPTQMMKLTDYYLGGNKAPTKANVLLDQKMYCLIEYALSSTKITYEQDDYYNLFGVDSNIFNAISLIRNSLAHNNYSFDDLAKKINYVDKDRTLTESIEKTAIKLVIIDTQKQILKNLQDSGNIKHIQDLADRFKEIFGFFFGDTRTIEEIATAMPHLEN